MKKEERSNYDEIRENIHERNKDCNVLLEEIDKYMESYYSMATMTNIKKEYKLGTLASLEQSINVLLKMLEKDVREIAQFYSYLQLIVQMQISMFDQPNIKAETEDAIAEKSGLQCQYDKMQELKEEYVKEFNETSQAIYALFISTKESLGVDNNYDGFDIDEDFIGKSIDDMDYDELAESIEEEDYPENSEDEYGDDDDFNS